jgi:excisionase family DNA binding protein
MKIGDEEVLTINQAAERIDISPTTLRLQIQRGKIEAEKFGRQWVIRATEIARYAEETRGKHGFAAETHPYHGKRPPRHTEDG